jgi:hypothetical protein
VSDPDYHARAQENAPRTAAEIDRAARDLASKGFSDHTVAAILKLDVSAIRQMLGERGRA